MVSPLNRYGAIAVALCMIVGGPLSAADIPPAIAAYLDVDLLMVARHRQYPYRKVVRRAATGDREALLSLVRFTPQLSGLASPSADHGGVLTRLYERLGAEPFRDVFRRVPRKTRDEALGLMRIMSYHSERLRLP